MGSIEISFCEDEKPSRIYRNCTGTHRRIFVDDKLLVHSSNIMGGNVSHRIKNEENEQKQTR